MKKFIISCLSKKGWSQLEKRRLSPLVSTLLGIGIISSHADGGSKLFPVRSWTSPVVRSLPIGNDFFCLPGNNKISYYGEMLSKLKY